MGFQLPKFGAGKGPRVPWLDEQGAPPDALTAWRVGYSAGYYRALYHIIVGRRMRRSIPKLLVHLLRYHREVLNLRRGPLREPPEPTPIPHLENVAPCRPRQVRRLPWEGARGLRPLLFPTEREAAAGLDESPTEEEAET